jgi:hypothetical protein
MRTVLRGRADGHPLMPLLKTKQTSPDTRPGVRAVLVGSGVGKPLAPADKLEAAGLPGSVVGGVLQERSKGLGQLTDTVERLDRRPMNVGARHAGECMTASYGLPCGRPSVTPADRQANAPAWVVGAIRGSLGSTALVRELLPDPAGELARGIGPERVAQEVVP